MNHKGLVAAAMLVSAWLLSTFTFVFGAVPLLRLATLISWQIYATCIFFVSIGSWLLGASFASIFFFSASVLIFTFHMVSQKYKIKTAAVAAVGMGSLCLGLLGVLWTHLRPQQFGLIKKVMVESFHKLYPDLTAQQANQLMADILLQIPSVVIIACCLAIWMALALSSRQQWTVSYLKKVNYFLVECRAPDFLIWLLIASIMGSFLNGTTETIKAVSINILNVTATLYFFQGLSVCLCYFKKARLSRTWKVFLIVLLTTQLFLIVSVLGVVDYWASFREKLKKSNEKQPDKNWMESE